MIKSKRFKYSELIHMSVVLIAILAFSLFVLSLNFTDSLHPALYSHLRFPFMDSFVKVVFLLLALALWLTYRRWQKAAKRQEELENIISSINPHILIVVDRDGKISMCNYAVRNVLGYEVEEVVNQKPEILFFGLEPVSTEKPGPADGIEGENVRVGLATGKKKNGEPLPLEVISGRLSGNSGTVMLLSDITQRRQTEEKLETAVRESEITSQQLEQALEFAHQAAFESEISNNAKSEFLAKMSHEIRTPMNGIMGMTDLLLDTDLSVEQCEYAETVKGSAESLLAIINDILDFSKIEAGKMELESIDFDLRTCVEEVGDMLAQRAQEKGLELAILMHYDVPTRIKGDPGRLRQVLVNLVNNAIKFTEKGEVLIRVSLADLTATHEAARFAVIDTGIGITPDRRDRLFKPFSQVDASNTRKYGGTGLGLAVSKQLVEAMGGRISVQSEESKGSVFSFTAVFERQLDEREAPESFQDADIGGLRVLVVDDSATNRKVFQEQLKAWGCYTEDATNAFKALNMLQAAVEAQKPYDLALIDFHMAGMDGEELARKIRSDSMIAHTPLVLITSIPQRGDAAKMLDVGFDAYLTKPVKQVQIHDTIAMVMGLRRKTDPAKERSLVTQHTLKEAARGRYKILLVEDNIVNQKVASRMLEKAGFRCDVAENGREALEAVFRIPYDLVFMDCQMPVMDGYEATREIRKIEEKGRHTHIVAMTAHAMKGDREHCLEVGMDDYITKPVTFASLCEILERYLGTGGQYEQASPQEEAGQTVPVRIARIQEIADGNREMESELIDLFLSENEKRFQALESAIRGKDAEQVRHEAHTIKGSSANAGAQGMQAIAHILEQMSEQGRIDPALQTLTTLRNEFKRVRDFFDDYLNTRDSSSLGQI